MDLFHLPMLRQQIFCLNNEILEVNSKWENDDLDEFLLFLCRLVVERFIFSLVNSFDSFIHLFIPAKRKEKIVSRLLCFRSFLFVSICFSLSDVYSSIEIRRFER